MSVDVESGPARALRALQKFDQLADVWKHSPRQARPLFIEALDALGTELELECTGVRDDIVAGHGGKTYHVRGYSHNGDTCPIHEWLVESDCQEDEDADG